MDKVLTLTMFPDILLEILLTLAAVIFAQALIHETLGRMVHRVIRSHKYESKTEERRREETLVRVFDNLSSGILWTIGVTVILGNEMHIHLATLLTGAGLVGVVVGLGAQSILRDCLAGIMVIMENQYRVGDVISMSAGMGTPVSGVVEDISIRATRLRDVDGNLHIVANGSAGVVTNQSYKFANVNVTLRVAFDTDIDKLENIINEAGESLAHDKAWRESIIDPITFLRIDNFDNGAMTVSALGKVSPAAQWEVAGAFRRQVQTIFKKNRIKLV